MGIKDQFQLLARLDQLIRLRATGAPAMLAQRFEVSERTIYNLLNHLKDMGAPVQYCRDRQSYIYPDGSTFRFGLVP